jgi:chromate reductase, NAD(P)H dehydrogenase (quinone)
MILIVHGTNRVSSLSKYVSEFVVRHLKTITDEDVKLLDLASIPMSAFDSSYMYVKDQVSEEIEWIQVELLKPANKFIFVSPEYNGSIPGILKLFIDACSIRDARACFYHKKALLLGVASGRAGNLRGLDHLAGILMYMNTIIYPNKLPISKIESLLGDGQALTDESTLATIQSILNDFLAF